MRTEPLPFSPVPRLGSGPSRRRRLVLAACVVASISLVAASCGSDDDDAADTTAATSTVAPTTAVTTPTTVAETTANTTADTTTETAAETIAKTTEETTADTAADTTAETAGAGAFDLAAYCSAEIELEMAGANVEDPDADPVGVAQLLLAAVDPVIALAPPELADDFQAAEDGLNTAIDTADGSAIDAIDLSEIQQYGADNCGWKPVAVEMTSYHFDGIPTELAAGDYDFAATNGSPEPHLLLLVKKKEGVTATWEELLASPEGQSQVETLGAAFAPTGGTAHAIARLEPGEYLALCPISEGTTMQAEGSGPPHFVLGMQQVVTVTG